MSEYTFLPIKTEQPEFPINLDWLFHFNNEMIPYDFLKLYYEDKDISIIKCIFLLFDETYNDIMKTKIIEYYYNYSIDSTLLANNILLLPKLISKKIIILLLAKNKKYYYQKLNMDELVKFIENVIIQATFLVLNDIK